LLERWFIKTAINVFVVLGDQITWAETVLSGATPPRFLVEAAFGLSSLSPPMGLYVHASAGDQLFFTDSVQMAPLFNDHGAATGALFGFRGVNFLLYFGQEELPPKLSIRTLRHGGWITRGVSYHLARLSFNVGKYLSHYIDIKWT
jgi:hypothetical protein